MRTRRRVAKGLVALVLGLSALVIVTWRIVRSRVGDPAGQLGAEWHEGQRVLDREGKLLRDIPSTKGDRGASLTLDRMGERIVATTLMGEDREFFEHDGVDTYAVGRALLTDVWFGRRVSGASTITEQLVKLLDHEGEPHARTVAVKVEEMARAKNLEEQVGKRVILEAYLNRLSYGHGLVGPEAAARGYFGVAARDLSWAQAAVLAVLPRAPSYLDPYTHSDRVELRQKALLEALRAHGAISDADLARAKSEAVKPIPLEHPFLAPHFVDALRDAHALAEHGATVTTLDLGLEEEVAGLVRTHLAAARALGATNASVLVVDNASGEVLAYVGGADYDDPEIAGNVDLARARRQPGSSLKPFVYGLAFEHGHTATDMLADVPTSFAASGGTYAPSNFDGTFEGPVSAREALAGSLNIPAIRLAAELPPGALLERLHALGFMLPETAEHYGLALALGSGEVTLKELATAYVALARGGDLVPLRMTVDAPSALGRAAVGTRVMDADVAANLAEILSDPLARVRGLHGRGPFDFGFPVAVKTGTSSGYRDAWTSGFTHERTVAVWVGNADGAPMRGLAGASGAGPLFADVMRRAMADVTSRAALWDATELVDAEVCPLSGELADDACPDRVTRRFARGHAPHAHCSVHARVAEVTTPGKPAELRCEAAGSRTVALFPDVYDAWLAGQPRGAPGRDPLGVSWFSRTRVSGCAGDVERARVRIDSPADGSVLIARRDGETQRAIELRASTPYDGDLEFTMDGRLVARTRAPFRALVPATPGDHFVVARPAEGGSAYAVSHFSVR